MQNTANQVQARSHSALHSLNEESKLEQKYSTPNKRRTSKIGSILTANSAHSTSNSDQLQQMLVATTEKPRFNFEEWMNNKRKEKLENHRQWVKQVLVQDESIKSKAQKVMNRAENELVNASHYLEEEKNDTVNACKTTIANINQACSERLEEL